MDTSNQPISGQLPRSSSNNSSAESSSAASSSAASSCDASSTSPASEESESSSSQSTPNRRNKSRGSRSSGTPSVGLSILRTPLSPIQLLCTDPHSYPSFTTLFSPDQLTSMHLSFFAAVTLPAPEPQLLSYYLHHFPALPSSTFITPASLASSLHFSSPPQPPKAFSYCGLPLAELLDRTRSLLNPQHSKYSSYIMIYHLFCIFFLLRKPPSEPLLPNVLLADPFLCLCLAQPYPFHNLIIQALQDRHKRFSTQLKKPSASSFTQPCSSLITFFLRQPGASEPRAKLRRPRPASTASASLHVIATTSPANTVPVPRAATHKRPRVVRDNPLRIAQLPPEERPYSFIGTCSAPLPRSPSMATPSYAHTSIPTPSTPADTQPSVTASPASPVRSVTASPQPSVTASPASPAMRRGSRVLLGPSSPSDHNLRYPRAEASITEFNEAVTHFDQGSLKLIRVFNKNVEAIRDLRENLRLALHDIDERDNTISELQTEIDSLKTTVQAQAAEIALTTDLRAEITSLRQQLDIVEASSRKDRADADSLRQWQSSLAALLQPLHTITPSPSTSAPAPSSTSAAPTPK